MIPPLFLERMRLLLGDEYEKFCVALSEGESVHAVRYNPDKISKEAFLSTFEKELRPLSYSKEGYISSLAKIGHHPLHHAGAVYSQDPGAIAPLSCLTIEKGWRVADFCAAPGGKSTQIASAVGDAGFLLSNEINLPRCRTLAGNIERLGVKNAFVTNVSTDVIASWFSSFFDLVVVDAPCSGEGMFRKYDVAGEEWKPELVPMCSARQKEILAHAAAVVKDGGYLLYSTCTFSLEANEEHIDAFLESHPAFSVCEVSDEVKAVTANGIAFAGAKHAEALKKARRFYPHIHPGEGQFMCLLQKTGGEEPSRVCYQGVKNAISKEEKKVVEAFFKEVFVKPISEILPDYILIKQGETISLIPDGVPLPPNRVYLAGVTVGTVQKGRLAPHHHLFSALGKYFRIQLPLALDSKELQAYLHGETIPVEGLSDGFGVVTVLGASLGGIKVVGNVAKNHYPKGLRTP